MKKRAKPMRQQMRAFDTYTHINELKKAGFNENQAAVIIKSLVDSRETDISHLATKEQVNAIEHRLVTIEHRLVTIEKTIVTKDQINILRNEMKAMILDTQANTLKWMVGTMIALVGVIIAAIKLF